MGSMLPLVGAAAHIGPPAAVCKVVRRALAAKPPLGDQGEVAGRRPDGGDQSWQRPEAYNPSVSLREPAPFAQGSLPSQASGQAAFGEGASDAAASGGYKIRPYRHASGLLVGAAAHIGPPGPGASTANPSNVVPGSGRKMRAPTV